MAKSLTQTQGVVLPAQSQARSQGRHALLHALHDTELFESTRNLSKSQRKDKEMRSRCTLQRQWISIDQVPALHTWTLLVCASFIASATSCDSSCAAPEGTKELSRLLVDVWYLQLLSELKINSV